jgi:hypothetical protein
MKTAAGKPGVPRERDARVFAGKQITRGKPALDDRHRDRTGGSVSEDREIDLIGTET